MKKIFYLCYRGTGFDSEHAARAGLIRAGHFGIYFQDEPDMIFGFHPTQEAADATGGEEALLEILKEEKTAVEGTVQLDNEFFKEAHQLSLTEFAEDEDRRTFVWEVEIEVSDEKFEAIRKQIYQWYNLKRTDLYAFPQNNPSAHNCATFIQLLGLPLVEGTGSIKRTIQTMRKYPSFKRWKG